MLLETGGDPCNKADELCSCVLWKVKLVSDETGYLAVEISKQSTAVTAYSKMRKRKTEGFVKQKGTRT